MAALPRRGKKRDPELDEAGWQCEPAAGAGKAAFRRLAGRWVASAGPRGGAVVSSPAPVLCAPFSDPGRDWRAHLVVGGEKRSSTRDSLPERCSVEGTQPCCLLSLQGKHRARSPPSAFPPVSWQAAEERLAESHVPPKLNTSLCKARVYVYTHSHSRSSSKTSYKALRQQE